MGLQLYFLAVSNNYPILWDAIARTRAENQLLAASGEKQFLYGDKYFPP